MCVKTAPMASFGDLEYWQQALVLLEYFYGHPNPTAYCKKVPLAVLGEMRNLVYQDMLTFVYVDKDMILEDNDFTRFISYLDDEIVYKISLKCPHKIASHPLIHPSRSARFRTP